MAVCASLVLSSTAGAQTYCVGTVPLCAGTVETGDAAGLQAALTAAAASPAEADRVLVGPGIFSSPNSSGFSYTDATGDSIEIAGQGASTQLLSSATSGLQAVRLDLNPISSIHGFSFGPTTAAVNAGFADLRLNGGSGYDLSFNSAAANANWWWGVVLTNNNGDPVALRNATVTGNGAATSGGIRVDSDTTASIANVHVGNVRTGIYLDNTASASIRDSLVDLGSLQGWGIYLDGNAGNAAVSATLDHVTIVGDANASRGVEMQGFADYTTPPYPTVTLTMSNSIVDIAGAVSHDLACPNDGMVYANISVMLSYYNAWDPASVDGGACSLNAIPAVDRANTPLNFTNAAAGDFTLGSGSPAIDAGDPAFVPADGEIDLAGNCRVAGAATDLGAYESGCPHSTPKPTPTTNTPLTLKFGKTRGKIRVSKKPRTLRKGTKHSKPRLAVTLNAAATVTFKLAPKPKSKGMKMKSMKGSVKLRLAAGTNYLTWSGKWGKKKLRAGSYLLSASALGLSRPVTLKVKIAR